MVTASVCHGGPGLPVFPNAVYSYFKNPNSDDVIDEISKEDVVDMEVTKAVNKVKPMYGYIAGQEFPRSLEVENCHRAQFF